MATDTFEGLPPFPDDVITAPLLRLSYKKLLDGDEGESLRLYEACKDVGFFYLDFTENEAGRDFLQDVDALFKLSEEFFALSAEEKMKYDFMSTTKTYFGYKPLGRNFADKSGARDRHEYYNISKDDILKNPGRDGFPAPAMMEQSRPLLQHYTLAANGIVALILSHLNTHLRLPPGTLQSLHRTSAVSGDHVRFLRTPPPPPDATRGLALGEHSDFGSVTVLFNRLGGLQILPPGRGAAWSYVRPLPGHAVINLGDAMVKFTNGLLRSNIHRVATPPGAQAGAVRYSMVYFSRPEDEVLLKRLDSPVIPRVVDEAEAFNSREWILRRALARNAETVEDVDWDKALGTEEQSKRIVLV